MSAAHTKPFKKCASCQTYYKTRADFERLPFVGTQYSEDDDFVFSIALRNCGCGSTIGVETQVPKTSVSLLQALVSGDLNWYKVSYTFTGAGTGQANVWARDHEDAKEQTRKLSQKEGIAFTSVVKQDQPEWIKAMQSELSNKGGKQ